MCLCVRVCTLYTKIRKYTRLYLLKKIYLKILLFYTETCHTDASLCTQSDPELERVIKVEAVTDPAKQQKINQGNEFILCETLNLPHCNNPRRHIRTYMNTHAHEHIYVVYPAFIM